MDLVLSKWEMKQAQTYRQAVYSAGAQFQIAPCVIAAIISRESGWGWFLKPRGVAGLGDGGHGHGLGQIDDGSYPDFCASEDWKDPAKNISKTAEVLREKLNYLKSKGVSEGLLLQAGIAAYNCGQDKVYRAIRDGIDIDFYTTGKNYSFNTLERMRFFRQNGWD